MMKTADEPEKPHRGTEEDPEENILPERAARVFSSEKNPLTETRELWEMEYEKDLNNRDLQDFSKHEYQNNWTKHLPKEACGWGCPHRDALKVCVSLLTAALFCPLLVWGGFVFLPFDAPLLHGATLRLVYTLRCSVFAAAPVILGWLVLGISRLKFGAVRPLVEDELKEAELQEVAVHRRYITDSATLYVMYFLQLVIVAMFVSQEQLKIIPLLTVVFTFGRLVYWISAAFNSSVRAFGFGLSFLPCVAMLVANLSFIFSVETVPSVGGSSSRQRFWG